MIKQLIFSACSLTCSYALSKSCPDLGGNAPFNQTYKKLPSDNTYIQTDADTHSYNVGNYVRMEKLIPSDSEDKPKELNILCKDINHLSARWCYVVGTNPFYSSTSFICCAAAHANVSYVLGDDGEPRTFKITIHDQEHSNFRGSCHSGIKSSLYIPQRLRYFTVSKLETDNAVEETYGSGALSDDEDLSYSDDGLYDTTNTEDYTSSTPHHPSNVKITAVIKKRKDHSQNYFEEQASDSGEITGIQSKPTHRHHHHSHKAADAHTEGSHSTTTPTTALNIHTAAKLNHRHKHHHSGNQGVKSDSSMDSLYPGEELHRSHNGMEMGAEIESVVTAAAATEQPSSSATQTDTQFVRLSIAPYEGEPVETDLEYYQDEIEYAPFDSDNPHERFHIISRLGKQASSDNEDGTEHNHREHVNVLSQHGNARELEIDIDISDRPNAGAYIQLSKLIALIVPIVLAVMQP